MDMLQLQNPTANEMDDITIPHTTTQKAQTEEAPRIIPAEREMPTPFPDPT